MPLPGFRMLLRVDLLRTSLPSGNLGEKRQRRKQWSQAPTMASPLEELYGISDCGATSRRFENGEKCSASCKQAHILSIKVRLRVKLDIALTHNESNVHRSDARADRRLV